MKVLIYGGRDWANRESLYFALDTFHKEYTFTSVIQGEAKGADTMAKEWAISRGIPQKGYVAHWNIYGGSAGPIRNRQMLFDGQPEITVEFAGGRGTAHMRLLLNAAKILVLEVKG